MKYISKSIEETAKLAEKVLADLKPQIRATVLALYGDLGSGKTTFVQQLGKLLGIKRSLQSPTFVIMKNYTLKGATFSHFIHIDAYRLQSEAELTQLGFAELLKDPRNLIALEWAERVEGLLPADALRIRFKFVDDTTREIEFDNKG